MAASDLSRASYLLYPSLGADKPNRDGGGEDAFNDCPPELSQDGRREVQLKLPQKRKKKKKNILCWAFFDYGGDVVIPGSPQL